MQKAAEKRLSEAISGPAISLLDSAPDDLWPCLERLYHGALKQAQAATSAGVARSDAHPTDIIYGPVAATTAIATARTDITRSALANAFPHKPYYCVYESNAGRCK